MTQQDQFLNVIDRDAAELRFQAALACTRLGVEQVPLVQALGRVLAEDVLAQVDVPAFDRSNVDGFAVQAEDTYGASELAPRRVRLLPAALEAGTPAKERLNPGEAISIATGGMLPRGADALVMIEHAEAQAEELAAT